MPKWHRPDCFRHRIVSQPNVLVLDCHRCQKVTAPKHRECFREQVHFVYSIENLNELQYLCTKRVFLKQGIWFHGYSCQKRLWRFFSAEQCVEAEAERCFYKLFGQMSNICSDSELTFRCHHYKVLLLCFYFCPVFSYLPLIIWRFYFYGSNLATNMFCVVVFSTMKREACAWIPNTTIFWRRRVEFLKKLILILEH